MYFRLHEIWQSIKQVKGNVKKQVLVGDLSGFCDSDCVWAHVWTRDKRKKRERGRESCIIPCPCCSELKRKLHLIACTFVVYVVVICESVQQNNDFRMISEMEQNVDCMCEWWQLWKIEMLILTSNLCVCVCVCVCVYVWEREREREREIQHIW